MNQNKTIRFVILLHIRSQPAELLHRWVEPGRAEPSRAGPSLINAPTSERHSPEKTVAAAGLPAGSLQANPPDRTPKPGHV